MAWGGLSFCLQHPLENRPESWPWPLRGSSPPSPALGMRVFLASPTPRGLQEHSLEMVIVLRTPAWCIWLNPVRASLSPFKIWCWGGCGDPFVLLPPRQASCINSLCFLKMPPTSQGALRLSWISPRPPCTGSQFQIRPRKLRGGL